MASNTITVNPRRKSAKALPPVASSTNQNKETILLRTAMPKYSFEQQKPKKKSSTETTKPKDSDKESSSTVGISKSTGSLSEMNVKPKIVKSATELHETLPSVTPSAPLDSLQIGRLLNSFPQTMISPDSLKQSESVRGPLQKLETSESPGTVTPSGLNGQKDKPVNKVEPISVNSDTSLTHSVSDSILGVQQVSKQSMQYTLQKSTTERNSVQNSTGGTVGATGSHNSSENQTGSEVSVTESDSAASKVVNQSTVAGSQCVGGCSSGEKVKQLEEEKQMLKNQLEVQWQVNQELKKLLVASVGEDLQHRVERLTRDKALLSLEMGEYSKKMCDDYENMDKISIQADMWRSKYLACRVMADEMASSKAFYTMQVQECQMALEKLLSERHQLRANLYDTYRGLEQIQEAFDPLHSQMSRPRLLTSKNVIDLARTNQHLMESIKYRLLPSHVTSSINSNMEPDWHDYLTQAEAHAKELLSREARPEDFRCLVSHRAPGALSVDRYHPLTNYDNLTINVCCKCKGEIRIV